MSKRVTPRLIRLKDAPGYLGTNINYFNKNIRPYLQVIRIGEQGIAFDRLDLDAWVEHYKYRNGRPAKKKEEVKLWDARKHQGSRNATESGTLTKRSLDREYMEALEQVTSRKRKKY